MYTPHQKPEAVARRPEGDRRKETRPMRILLVEDDEKIASFIIGGLRQSGFAVPPLQQRFAMFLRLIEPLNEIEEGDPAVRLGGVGYSLERERNSSRDFNARDVTP